MRWVVLLGALAGCQDLFKLEHVDKPADARADATADAPVPDGILPTYCWDTTRTGNDDGDAYIDGCDPCPGNPDMNPTDSDSDGIPDVCDPEVGHNTVVGFYDLQTINGWNVTSGSWGPGTSSIAQTDNSFAEALIQLQTTVPDTTWVQVQLAAPDPPAGADTKVGVYLAVNGSTSLYDGLTCTIVHPQASMMAYLRPEYWSQGAPQTSIDAGLGQVSTVWVTARVSDGQCQAYAGAVHVASSAPAGVLRTPTISLRTSFSTGTFLSITLFSSAI